ncbi:hypothetical protein JP0124_03500 [Helicobacter pylori]
MKSFSLPFNLQLNPPIKKALSERLSLNLASSFSLTKNTKKGFCIKPPKKKNLKKRLQKSFKKKKVLKKEFKKKEFKKKEFKKERLQKKRI